MKFLLALTAFFTFASTASIPHDVAAPPRLIDPRIVGGSDVDIRHHPHQVSLRYKNILKPDDAYSHLCGGSLIASNMVVTAAHCIIARLASGIMVVGGTNQRRGGDGHIAQVKEIIMHEEYNPETYDNDIALLILSVPMPINNYTIKAVQLATNEPRVGAISLVTGWGNTRQQGTAANTLQQVQVPIVSNADCNEDYMGQITDSMLCAGIRGEGGKDSCQGDSGGPMVCDGMLVGVVSWGWGCAQPEFPGVYAKISYLRSWLSKKIEAANAMNIP